MSACRTCQGALFEHRTLPLISKIGPYLGKKTLCDYYLKGMSEGFHTMYLCFWIFLSDEKEVEVEISQSF